MLPRSHSKNLYIGGPVYHVGDVFVDEHTRTSNVLDAETLLRFVREMRTGVAILVEHNNDIGAVGTTLDAWVTDDTLHVSAVIFQPYATIHADIWAKVFRCFALAWDKPADMPAHLTEVSVARASVFRNVDIEYISTEFPYEFVPLGG